MVPWAYGPDCRPGTLGFMTGCLRPPELWIAGLPTILRRWEREHAALARRPPARAMPDNVFRAVAQRTGAPGR